MSDAVGGHQFHVKHVRRWDPAVHAPGPVNLAT